MNKTAVVDRFEGEYAVLEWEDKIFNVPRGVLPPETREGDVLEIWFNLRKDLTEERAKRIRELEDKLFREE